MKFSILANSEFKKNSVQKEGDVSESEKSEKLSMESSKIDEEDSDKDKDKDDDDDDDDDVDHVEDVEVNCFKSVMLHECVSLFRLI